MATPSNSFSKQLRKHYQRIGKKGGEAGKGEAKKRTSEQASRAAKARWAKWEKEHPEQAAKRKLKADD